MRPGRGNSSAASGTETDTSVSNYPPRGGNLASSRANAPRNDNRNESPAPRSANGDRQYEVAPKEQRDSRRGGGGNNNRPQSKNGVSQRNGQKEGANSEINAGKISQNSTSSKPKNMVNGESA